MIFHRPQGFTGPRINGVVLLIRSRTCGVMGFRVFCVWALEFSARSVFRTSRLGSFREDVMHSSATLILPLIGLNPKP